MNALYVNISDEITLRKETLLTIKTLPIRYNFNEEDRAFFYAQAIPMIYAVWEGFTKKCFDAYITALNILKLKASETIDTIVQFQLEYAPMLIQNYPENNKKKPDYYEKLRLFFTKDEINLPILTDTKDNVGFNIINNLLETFGLLKLQEQRRIENIPEHIADRFFPHIKHISLYPIEIEMSNSSKHTGLLRLRNGITHGNPTEGVIIDDLYVDRFVFLVEFLMDEVFEKIKEGYEAQTYLKEEFRTPKASS